MLAITMERRINTNKAKIAEIEQRLNKITEALTELIVMISESERINYAQEYELCPHNSTNKK